MQFLSPIWFFALAALSIPVVIHLWNIRPGKTLKVGSIALITEASKTSSRSFKLLDILLLILRCLLLAALGLFLAAPVWNHIKPAGKIKGWVLIPRENFKETYKTFKPKVDSLNKAGYEFHYFDSGFAKGELAKILADTTLKDTSSNTNYWNLTRQLNSKVSSGLPIFIFTPNGIQHFTGSKPASGLNLHWQSYTAADSMSKWIASASFADNGTMKVTQGNSSPTGTFYTEQYIQNDGNANIEVNVTNGQPVVSLKGSNAAIPVDTSTLRIAIYTDKYALDAGYLKAALLAATNFTGRKSLVEQYSNPGQIPGGQTWLFWLSDQPVDRRLSSNVRNVFKYEGGKIVSVHSWIDAAEGLINPGKKIALNKIVLSEKSGEKIWKDGFGEAVLSEVNQRYLKIFRFYSHFNPAWGDLVWSDEFPQMMLKLIIGNEYELPSKYDKRVLTNQQIQPVKVDGITKEMTPANPAEQVDLSHYFWLLIVLLFIAERLLSHRNKTLSINE
ncbi:BatA domain-containing protein [Mucilaginibacter glaciei]|uniref:BatA domain-containing protein n=1 Tax=Mucilaginibacter glaciei TaxID=2772109 RepID=A0A926NQB4_9SPHI|nr:BatA domain-containing protein [Mucilaginibacter glaciei]MBD1392722.1 BatA domain-containing protein [Mucilaginibacter glaciei]